LRFIGVIVGGSNDGPVRFAGRYTFDTRRMGVVGCVMRRENRGERVTGLLACALVELAELVGAFSVAPRHALAWGGVLGVEDF
jgi:hypothetical protein